jgi:hypothetical protein
MTVWAKRRYSPKGHLADVATFRERFERHRQAGMMMIEARAENTDFHRDVYVGVPDRQILGMFVGYKVIEETDLPKQALMLAGDESEFSNRFADRIFELKADPEPRDRGSNADSFGPGAIIES